MTIDRLDPKTVFVMGPPCSGKRAFIKHCFPEHFEVDLYEFQDGTVARASTWQSYLLCQDALVEALKSHERVVLKHTLISVAHGLVPQILNTFNLAISSRINKI